MSAQADANGVEARGSLHDLRQVLSELRSEPRALREEVDALTEEFDAYKEEVCELRSALDSERLERASMEWKLDNLAADFGDLVDGLKDAGVLVLGRGAEGEELVAQTVCDYGGLCGRAVFGDGDCGDAVVVARGGVVAAVEVFGAGSG